MCRGCHLTLFIEKSVHTVRKQPSKVKDILYDKTNTDSFRVMKEQGLTNSNFLVWTGLRQSVPSKLRLNIQNFKTVNDLEN